jgi:hypothetical protein
MTDVHAIISMIPPVDAAAIMMISVAADMVITEAVGAIAIIITHQVDHHIPGHRTQDHLVIQGVAQVGVHHLRVLL